MRKIISIIFLLGCILNAIAADTTTDYPKLVEKLLAENAQLKEEIQNLRKLLASSTTQTVPVGNSSTATTIPSKPAVSSASDNQSAYWLTSSSHKRHNSSCRYYHNSNGRPCGPNDGIPCKICGG